MICKSLDHNLSKAPLVDFQDNMKDQYHSKNVEQENENQS